MKKIAVMGYGTIGSGVVEVFEVNKEVIAKRVGEEVEVKYILDLRDFPGTPVEHKIVHDVQTILDDPEISVVVETMGGVEPARTFVERALRAGKSAVTSNKDLVAKCGPELMAAARENHVGFSFEAAVGGGIPIIRPINEALSGDVIEEITGILNGTTNFILTKMNAEGRSFEDVLKEAQELGYAERNPSADVDGFDAARKIAILTSLATGKLVNYEDLYTEGITKITDVDFKYAKVMEKGIKLFASCKKTEDKFCAMVAPRLVDKTHPLYGVNDVFNAVMVKGNMVGDLMFYGAGAGKLPTASAVAADVIDCIKRANHPTVYGWSEEKLEMLDSAQTVKSFFVRVEGHKTERAGLVESIFGEVLFEELAGMDEFAFITKPMSEAEFAEKCKSLTGIRNRIRIEE